MTGVLVHSVKSHGLLKGKAKLPLWKKVKNVLELVLGKYYLGLMKNLEPALGFSRNKE